VGKLYPPELRERVLLAGDEGAPVGQIAKRFKVSVSYVSKVLSRRAKTGETSARPQLNHVLAKFAAHEAAMKTRLAAEPDVTLAELQAWIAKEHGLSVSLRVIWKTLKRLNITREKAPARGRAGPAGCCRAARRLAHSPGHVEPRETGLHRRTEPRRVCRRLHSLKGWSDDEKDLQSIFT
jgi:transposase